MLWLSGVVATYFLARHDIMGCGEWSVGDRNLVIIISIFSWVGLICGLLVILLKKITNNDRPAKW
jgi:hypothetical protein